jgi:hypothetical protein
MHEVAGEVMGLAVSRDDDSPAREDLYMPPVPNPPPPSAGSTFSGALGRASYGAPPIGPYLLVK